MKLKAIRRANTKKPKPDRPNQWIVHYNNSYLHSTLGYMPSEKFENGFTQKQQTKIILKQAC